MLTFELKLSAREEKKPQPVMSLPSPGRKIMVKAISVRQPWAWLLIHGRKDIENRSRATSYRGPIYIHASKTFDWEGFDWLMENMRDTAIKAIEHFGIVPLHEPDLKATKGEFGGIIGGACLSDCVTSSPSPWFAGPYGYKMDRAVPLPFYACKGQLGIFNVEIETKG